MALRETPQARTPCTSRPISVDPATRPFTIDQPSGFFALSLEVRGIVYEYVFYDDGQSRLPPRNARAALPLLTCRQFYVESRAIAFTNIRWNIDPRKDRGPYFDGIGLTGDGKPIMPPGMLKSKRGECAKPQPLATRSPVECTIHSICSRAGLSGQQIAAIRYLQVSYWCEDQEGLQHHLLSNIRQLFHTDFQLDCLTIEPSQYLSELDIESFTDPDSDLRRHWAHRIAWLWSQKVAKKIVIQPYNGPTYRPPPRAVFMTSESRNRMHWTNKYFLELYNLSSGPSSGSGVNTKTLDFDFDNENDPLHWHWKFYKEECSYDPDRWCISRIELTHGNGPPEKELTEQMLTEV